MENNLKYLWLRVKDKEEARLSISGVTGVNVFNIRKNWLMPSNFYYVPEKYKKETIEILQKIIKIQNDGKR